MLSTRTIRKQRRTLPLPSPFPVLSLSLALRINPCYFPPLPSLLPPSLFSVIHVYVLKHLRVNLVGNACPAFCRRVMSCDTRSASVGDRGETSASYRYIDIDTDTDTDVTTNVLPICSLSAPNPRIQSRSNASLDGCDVREREKERGARSHPRRRRVARRDDEDRWRPRRLTDGRTGTAATAATRVKLATHVTERHRHRRRL